METREHTSSFGALLRRYRGEQVLSQEELAARAGLSVHSISALERGITPWPYRDTVDRLATALRLAPAERRTLEVAARRPRRTGRTPEPASPPPVAGKATQTPEESRHATLPLPLTALIGRSVELERIQDLFTKPAGRLLTVTGPGGMGKTRLAIEAAHRLQGAYPDGVAFVELAPLQDGALVLPAIAQALDVRDAPGRSLGDAITAFIGQRQLLLVLDNCEHLIDACAELTAQLLAVCPRLSVLATSRTALRLRGEQVFPLAPLALPTLGSDAFTSDARLGERQDSPAAVQASPAVALFVERAAAVAPEFALTPENAHDVAAICRRLDGLPLAIELAAAHCATLAPRALLAYLAPSLPLLSGGARDLPARQQTLRAAIAWSYDLLPAEARRVFRCLAVCAGGCTIAAAAALCAVDAADPLAVLRHLETLVGAGLLAPVRRGPDEPRFAMLQTIRDYGVEVLEERGELDRLQARHAAQYRDLAEEAAPELLGPRASFWLERLDAEHDNLRAALSWALDAGEAQPAVATAGALWRFWRIRGHWTEGRRWLTLALESGHGAPDAFRARALIGAGTLAMDQGNYAQATALYEESLVLYRAQGDRLGIAQALNGLGIVVTNQGDDTRAVALYEESLALRRELGDTGGVAMTLSNLAQVAWRRGDWARATALQEEGLALDRTRGDRGGVSMALANLGILARQLGDYARATALQEESLAIKRELGDKRGIAASLDNLGEVARAQGAYARAAALYEESLAILRALDDRHGVAQSLGDLGAVACDRGEYERAGALLEESLAIMRALGSGRGVAVVLNELGRWAAEQGEYERAGALLEESLALFREMGERRGSAAALRNLGAVTERQGAYEWATTLCEESLALYRALGDKWGVAATLGSLGAVAYRQSEYIGAETLLAESLQLSHELGARHVVARALEVLAWVVLARGQPQRSAQLGGAAQALREALAVPLPPHQQDSHDRAVTALRAALGEEFAAAWAAGTALSPEKTLAAALDAPASAEATVVPLSNQSRALAEARLRQIRVSEKQDASLGGPNLQLLPGRSPSTPLEPAQGDERHSLER